MTADDAVEAGASTGVTSAATLPLLFDRAGIPPWSEGGDAWPLGRVAALWFAAPGLEAGGASEEAVAGVGRDGAVDELPVAGWDDVSSLVGAVALPLLDVLASDGGEVDEDELEDAAVDGVAPFDDEPSLAAEDLAALSPDVLATGEDGPDEGGLLDGAVLSVAPFDDGPPPYDVVPAPLPPDGLAVADGESGEDEPPDAAVLWLPPFDEVASDGDVGAAALPDVPPVDEGEEPGVDPEPDVVDPDVVEADDVLCDGLSCDEGAAVDDDPDEVDDGE